MSPANGEGREEDIPILDAWTPLSFKRALGNRKVGGRTWVQPSWVGFHARRLQAYDILTALADNAARYYMEASVDIRDAHREYGDAGLIVSSILAALLGDDQRVVTDGASNFDPNDPADKPVQGEPEGDQHKARAAFDFQTWCEEWADLERLGIKLVEGERNAVTRGDAVYAISWSAEKARPRLRVFDPGSYFPVLEDGNEDDFPSKVHVAWEIVPEDGVVDRVERQVHRLTWELIEVEQATKYPWNDAPTNTMCVYSDGIWTFDGTGKVTVDDFTSAKVEWAVTDVDGVPTQIDRLPLNVDFLPVIHIPNTVALLAHFGSSSLALVAQILDDLSNADTDLQAASATTGSPPIGLSGVRLAVDPVTKQPVQPRYGPGEVWQLGDEGKAEMIDTSSALDALLAYRADQLERLSTNSRLPGSFLGRAKPGDISSGIQLLLSFGPLKSMIQEMRLVRIEKHPLIFKFAHRFAVAAKMVGVPETWIPTKIEYGRFLPEDTAATVTQVQELLNAHAISRETAVHMLIGVGLPIDDAIDEVARIQEQDFAGAVQLLAALGPQGESHVFDYLGYEPVAPLTPPVPPPPGPNDPNQPKPPVPPVNPPLPPAPPVPPKPAPPKP